MRSTQCKFLFTAMFMLFALSTANAEPVKVKEVFIKPTQIQGGQPFQFTVRLNQKGTMNLKLSTSHPGIVGLPISKILHINNLSSKTISLPTTPITGPAVPVTVHVNAGALTYGASVLVKPATASTGGGGVSSTQTYVIRTDQDLKQLMQIAEKRGFQFKASIKEGKGYCNFRRTKSSMYTSHGKTKDNPRLVCRFSYFGGGKKLKDGWSIKSITVLSGKIQPQNKFWTFTAAPKPGTNDPFFEVQISRGNPQDTVIFDYDVDVKQINLTGPKNADWSQAF